MVKERDMTYRIRMALVRTASVLLLILVTVVFASSGFVYADHETEKEVPKREVHDVGVGNELYCFFVTHNVVLTPAEVTAMTDEELTSTILERSGLYMKKTNCKIASHKEITVKDWTNAKLGEFQLSESDLEAMRLAEPVDGEPFKFYMDLQIVRKTGEKKTVVNEEGEEVEEEETIQYSTFKRTSPRLLFAVVATEEDAKYGEDICIEDNQPQPAVTKKQKKKKQKTPAISEPEAPEEEMLPEYRTISMADRSGGPIEETLKDGSPVDLEWVEPQNTGADESSFIDRIPGGKIGLMAMATVAAAAVAAVVIAARNKKTDE